MGADLIMATCSSPRNLGLSDGQAEALLIRWALSLTRDEADAYLDQVTLSGENSVDDLYEAEGDATSTELLAATTDPDFPLTWVCKYIADDLIEAYQEVRSRDHVATLRLGGRTYLVAGGMSWGDEPEGCAELMKLDITGVFDSKRVLNLLDLSTAHIPEKILRAGSAGMSQNLLNISFAHRVENHGYGWIIFLGDKDEDYKVEDWAQPIVKLARANNCGFINFDQDGEVCEHLCDYTKGSPLEQLADTREVV